MEHMELTRSLREATETHYNCCQSVLVTFAEEMGLSREQAFALGTNFGSGMRHGAVCGALSGAMMVLGMAGYTEQEALTLLRQFKEKHNSTSCATLLKAALARGEVRKEHCDALVYELVDAVEQILQTKQ